MNRVLLSMPILNDQEVALRDKWSKIKGDENADFTRTREAAGVIAVRQFIQSTPSGSYGLVCWDLDTTLDNLMQHFGASADPYDVAFREFIRSVHGLDISATANPPRVEVVVDWSDPAWTIGSGEVWAMAVPLKSGATAVFRDEITAAYNGGSDEWCEWRRQCGFGVTTVCIQATPNHGDVALVYLEGNDIQAGLAQVRESDHSLSVMWRDLAPRAYAVDMTDGANVPKVEHVATVTVRAHALSN